MTDEWRKSSRSTPEGNCVEVAVVTAAGLPPGPVHARGRERFGDPRG